MFFLVFPLNVVNFSGAIFFTEIDYLNRAHRYGSILLELNITELELPFGPSRLLSTVQIKGMANITPGINIIPGISGIKK